MKTHSRVAIIQMRSDLEKSTNIKRAVAMITQAVDQGAECICLPETFNCLGTYPEMVDQAEAIPGRTINVLSDLASKHGVYIHCGSIFEKTEHSTKAFNTSVILDANGDIAATYRKIHLFDVDIPGDFNSYESHWVTPGDQIIALETPLGKIGLSICYDLRFPEIFRKLAQQGVQITFLPSAFRRTTGAAHWEILLRARAIENQSYVLAANQWGTPAVGISHYGNSMVVNPWGDVIARAQDESDSILVVDINLKELMTIRSQLPALKHRQIHEN